MSKKKPKSENTSPPEEITSEIVHSNQEIEIESDQKIVEIKVDTIENKNDMEIHPPHVNHQKRKFKEYIFEFLMLFIAVTAGFFMENLREYRIERHKENEYIQSMIKDIQDDTASIQKIMSDNDKQIKGIDSLLAFLETPVTPNRYNKFYNLALKNLSSYSDFRSRDITMVQLKNSGGLRLIENKSVSDSIVAYYSWFDQHLAQLDFNIKYFQNLIEMEMDFLDFAVIRNNHIKLSIDSSFNAKKFANHVTTLYFIVISENDWLKDYKLKGISLLNYLKLKYKIID
jgi:hypothetical protein